MLQLWDRHTVQKYLQLFQVFLHSVPTEGSRYDKILHAICHNCNISKVGYIY